MNKNTTISERISQMIEYLDITAHKFAEKLDYSRSQTMYDIINGKAKPSFDFFSRLNNSEYSEIFRYEWIIGGEEPMLKKKQMNYGNLLGNGNALIVNESRVDYEYDFGKLIKRLKFAEGVDISEEGAPFYPLAVSAGNTLELLEETEKPTGYVSLPGITCQAYFPVIGCSFEPIIRAGDIIGIEFINRWELLDPDCLYYIVTHDSRMLKRLMDHPKDSEKLICISPNLKEFTIWKSEIKVIHKVIFYGRPV